MTHCNDVDPTPHIRNTLMRSTACPRKQVARLAAQMNLRAAPLYGPQPAERSGPDAIRSRDRPLVPPLTTVHRATQIYARLRICIGVVTRQSR